MTHQPPDQPRPAPAPGRGWHPVAIILMVLTGIILLLPGLCAIGFAGSLLSSGDGLGNGMAILLIPIWLLCLGISFGGFLLIRSAFRGPRN